MRLGLNLGYWSSGDTFAAQRDLTRLAEAEGYSIVWVAEAYGSDAATILGGLAATTTTIGLGSAVFQIPARSAAMTVMTSATLDAMSAGRFHLGLGVSGPQVSEGWHGVRFDRPLARTREYLDVVRLGLAREVLQYKGSHLQLPLPEGPGKALKLGFAPVRSRLPIYLAAVGPKNLQLAGELADGWLGLFVDPDHPDETFTRLAEGRAKVGKSMDDFDICVSVPAAVHDDPEQAADLVRGYYALYIGGMGSREKNFYHATATRLGFGRQAYIVQDHFLAGRHRDAAAAVPFDLIDATALVGPESRIAQRLSRFADAGVTTLAISPFGDKTETVRTIAAANPSISSTTRYPGDRP